MYRLSVGTPICSHKVPKNLQKAGGAPLLCAGITCYSPFVRFGLKANDNLGVIGLGGLGHIAVKIAVAMGANVSSSFTIHPSSLCTAIIICTVN
jgi:uncharacterized zinc-type alcohol dehydrogenase-like protein